MEIVNGTILLAEDNEDDVFLMQRALKAAGITNGLRVVEDGQQVIEYLRGEGVYANRAEYPYPGMLFLDLKMPHKSGFDVLSWLQEQQATQRPVVFVLTSSNHPSDMDRARELGAQAYLIKPPQAVMLQRLAAQFNISTEKPAAGGSLCSKSSKT